MPPPRPRLRVPDSDVLDEADRLPALPPGVDVLRARLRLIVPAILGGFDANVADPLAPIRAKALRGQLRHWWRLLAAAGAFAEWGVPGGHSDADAQRLQRLDFQAWGALPTAASDAAVASDSPSSQVGVDVRVLGQLQEEGAALLLARCPDLAVGLYFAVANTRKLLMPPLAFELVVTVGQAGVSQLAAMLERTIVCWAALGGIGGRTSRGMGAVQLEAFELLHGGDQAQPLQLLPKALATARAPGAINLFGVAQGVLVDPDVAPGSDAARCALGWGLSQLMRFLQVPHGRPVRPNGRQGMSLWSEARLLRHLTKQHFVHSQNAADNHDPATTPARLPGGTPPAHVAPRIAFGHRMLRFVVREINPGKPEPAPHAIVPQGSDRLPSGVLIRPMLLPDASGRYGCLVVQRTDLAGDRLPPARFRSGRFERSEALRAWSPGWQAGQANGCANVAPLEQPGAGSGVFEPVQDAGQAFINLLYAGADRREAT